MAFERISYPLLVAPNTHMMPYCDSRNSKTIPVLDSGLLTACAGLRSGRPDRPEQKRRAVWASTPGRNATEVLVQVLLNFNSALLNHHTREYYSILQNQLHTRILSSRTYLVHFGKKILIQKCICLGHFKIHYYPQLTVYLENWPWG